MVANLFSWSRNVHTPAAITKLAVTIRDYAMAHYDVDFMRSLGSCTAMAECVAHDMGHDEWLDDETHIVWDVVCDLFALYKIEV